jgi:hypothetical protein
MRYGIKAIIIQMLLILVGSIMAIILNHFFISQEMPKAAFFCGFIPIMALGLNTLFGKYVYIRGCINKTERIVYGLFFLLIALVAFIVYYPR